MQQAIVFFIIWNKSKYMSKHSNINGTLIKNFQKNLDKLKLSMCILTE
jgi:hypothetical protein